MTDVATLIPQQRSECVCGLHTARHRVIDLFAGPGGWDVALGHLGRGDVIGVEWDGPACATGRAAGHARIQADITDLDPRQFAASHLVAVDGLIASPPCQGFSMAGKGEGRGDTPLILGAVEAIFEGADVDEALVRLAHVAADRRSALVLQPLRWALDLRPQWIAWEQVPAVLPLWDACASVLRHNGYSVWTGLLRAEMYGVPQTRKRAILIARRDGVTAAQPPPLFSSYNIRDPDKLDSGMERWVSMGEAFSVDCPSDWLFVGGPQERATIRTLDQPAPTVFTQRTANMRWVLLSTYSTHGDYTKRGFRTMEQPAPTVTTHVDRNKWLGEQVDPDTWVYRGSNQAHAAKRPFTAPAPTINFGARLNEVEWMPPETADDPAAGGIQVTIEEAAHLQTFPLGYPFQGTRTDQYRQIGDAVPPLLGAHILRAAGAACAGHPTPLPSLVVAEHA